MGNLNLPVWMEDPTLQDISKEKLMFYQNLIKSGQGLSKDKLLPFIMQITQTAKAQNLTFSKDEISRIIAAIKMHSSESEKKTIDKMMNLQKNRPHN